MAVGTVGTLLRPRLARHVGPLAVTAGVVTSVVFGIAGDPTSGPRLLPAVSPLQVPSLSFFGSTGEAVLLALALGPLVAAGLLVWTLLGASIDERRQMRWLALCLVTGVGAVAVMQLVRLLGLLEVGDGFLAGVPRAVAWAAVAAGAATTIVQPELGDAAIAVRRVAVGVGLVTILGAAGGLAWFAADATTAHIVPGAPVAATVLTIAALLLPVRDRLERAADRWLFGEVGSDARLIDTFGAAAEHAGRSEVLELLVATSRRALRLRWAARVHRGRRSGRRNRRRRRRRVAAGRRPLPADRERRAARAARVWAEAWRPAQRPRPPAPRRPRPRRPPCACAR